MKCPICNHEIVDTSDLSFKVELVGADEIIKTINEINHKIKMLKAQLNSIDINFDHTKPQN